MRRPAPQLPGRGRLCAVVLAGGGLAVAVSAVLASGGLTRVVEEDS
ncbi:hypothetical protein ACIGBH_31235 [Streptomyces sp. NPDC085929]